MFSIRQRYKFESKSQQCVKNWHLSSHCFRYVKDTNLKANHNTLCIYQLFLSIVFDTSKIQIWKQITTRLLYSLLRSQLFSIRQRYKFESKSQPPIIDAGLSAYCFRYVKDTNLKANHNQGARIVSEHRIVFDTSKIQIWKQITTIFHDGTQNGNCFRYVKDTNLKANHN